MPNNKVCRLTVRQPGNTVKRRRGVRMACLVALLLGAPVQASTFAYYGEVTQTALPPLFPIGSVLTGEFGFDVPGANQSSDDPGIVTSISLGLIWPGETDPVACFVYNSSDCEPRLGGVTFPLAQTPEFFVQFDGLEQPTGGVMRLIFGSIPTDAWLGFNFDLSNETFSVFGQFPGDVASGPGGFVSAAVPLPAASWMLLSALAVGFRPRRHAGE